MSGQAAKIVEELRPKNSGVEVICASKGHGIDELFALSRTAGVTVFAENRVQEFLDKYDPSLTWDFIGQLQTNKVKYIIDKVRLIHSVDRDSLAAEIDRQAAKHGKVQDILIEVNSGREPNKGGVFPEDAEAFCLACMSRKNLRVAGLMAVAPIVADGDALVPMFLEVKAVFDKLRTQHPSMVHLSMGMSSDFDLAVQCGSNMVRLGRVLFK